MTTQSRKKLIEVALPLPEINDASAYDKMPGIGPHPKGIHHWWARLPLPCARAVLFASVVTDPSDDPAWQGKPEAEQDAERERLFDIIRRLMQKKLHEHPEVYAEAQKEMLRHCDGKLPPVLDPFAGGGSIPLEAARLGFPAHAADLNPVAVLLNKCNLELAPRWADRMPVNPEDRRNDVGTQNWSGSRGLAADVRYYGRLIRAQAEAKIGSLYPKVQLPKELGGGDATVIAWIWARTVASQDPAAQGAHVPLVSSFWLDAPTKKSKPPYAWIEPVVDTKDWKWHFEVKTGVPDNPAAVRSGTKIGRGAKFKCLFSPQPLKDDHIKDESLAGNLKTRLLAIVAEGQRGRIYLPANAMHQEVADCAVPANCPTEEMANDPRNIWCVGYGLKRFDQLFTSRQLVGLTTLVSIAQGLRKRIIDDAVTAGIAMREAESYATSVQTFLALAVDRCADFGNALCGWASTNQKVMHLFGKQAIPMIWDFAEANLLADSVGGWSTCCDYVADCIQTIVVGEEQFGDATQADAAAGAAGVNGLMVSTDPPYYDNMSYASLSDFFYVWLRRTAGSLHPDICRTILVPKEPELIADAQRFAGKAGNAKELAKEHFESGFRKTFTSLRDRLDNRFPLTVYYAFKQEDEDEGGSTDGETDESVDLTTGWETLLEALISSGFSITATWPLRASQKWRQVSMGTNSLASYIVLACRPRNADAAQVDRRTFVAELKHKLPAALKHLQQGNIAPVDFAQAAIGPGMAIFSGHSRVLESSGKSMSVRSALSHINQTLTEVLSELEDEFDAGTRWAIAWFDQHGFDEGDYGDAELLSRAKVTSLTRLQNAGFIKSKASHVRLLRPDELPKDWEPKADHRPAIWEITHHLLRVYFFEKRGDAATADLLRAVGGDGELARDLAYRLFSLCEKKKRPQDALAYNALVLGWPEILRLSRERGGPVVRQKQATMFGDK